ncbi:MAG: hypothetical protein GX974_06010 [Clostridiales bacterium]|nr:hypothetical protein [Clostridiales bacterium]
MGSINENKAIAEIIKKNEKIIQDYAKEIQEGLRGKRMTIDDIETIMLKTMETIKHNVLATTTEIINEETKKKRRSKIL